MQDQLLSFVRKIKSENLMLHYDEAATKQAIILRMLAILGWDHFDADEVKPEYSLGDSRVDYALRIHGVNKVFVGVKKTAEELEKHQPQLLDYSFKNGVKLAVLTNAIQRTKAALF
jgi:predicted type IV restriction endonuclease